ncbi:HlyD family secretion protein [Brucella melitensis]|uniref:HlyD family secretion protein n=1 Tax=Brucella melitensis TaxID=29459 RepID=UPI0031FD1DF1
MAETNTSPSPAQDQSPKHPMLRRILLIVGPVVAIAIGLWIYFSGGQYVSEDDSYVGAAAVAITPQVSGQVIRVAVGPNQPVKEGDLLFEIDPQLDQAERALQVAKQEQNAAASAAAATLAQLGGTLDKPLQQHASYLAAKAEVELAERNVRLTRVLAPFAGTVTQVENIQPGSFLAVGDPAFTLIGADAWVNSNIKETDLTHIKVGDPATVVLDSYLDQPLQGEVQSITPASGSVFALLPAQNAAGNWVKVVQRMPVRIKITKPHPDVVMRDGGSATVTINTGYHRTFATLWRDLTGMVGID